MAYCKDKVYSVLLEKNQKLTLIIDVKLRMDDTYPFTSNWNSPTIRSEKLIHSFKMYSLYATQTIPVNQTLHCLFLIHII